MAIVNLAAARVTGGHRMSRASTMLVATYAVLASSTALAQQAKPDDRLREQLRVTMTQVRALSEENARLKTEVERLANQKPVEDTSRVDALSRRLSQQQQSTHDLEQKLAVAEAALTGARQALDASASERTEILTQLLAAQTESKRSATERDQCAAANGELVSISHELLVRYENRGVLDAILAREPLTGLRRAQLERFSQTYNSKIDAQAQSRRAPVNTQESSP